MPDNLRTVMVDGLSVSVTDQGAQAIDKLLKERDDARRVTADAKTAHSAALAGKDEEIGKLKADLKTAQDAANIDVSKLVADRVALEGQVKAIDSAIDPKGKTDAELRKAAVASKLGDELVADASDAEIVGMFKALSKDAKNEDVREALRQQDHSVNANDAWGGRVFDAAGVSMKKGA